MISFLMAGVQPRRSRGRRARDLRLRPARARGAALRCGARSRRTSRPRPETRTGPVAFAFGISARRRGTPRPLARRRAASATTRSTLRPSRRCPTACLLDAPRDRDVVLSSATTPSPSRPPYELATARVLANAADAIASSRSTPASFSSRAAAASLSLSISPAVATLPSLTSTTRPAPARCARPWAHAALATGSTRRARRGSRSSAGPARRAMASPSNTASTSWSTRHRQVRAAAVSAICATALSRGSICSASPETREVLVSTRSPPTRWIGQLVDDRLHRASTRLPAQGGRRARRPSGAGSASGVVDFTSFCDFPRRQLRIERASWGSRLQQHVRRVAVHLLRIRPDRLFVPAPRIGRRARRTRCRRPAEQRRVLLRCRKSSYARRAFCNSTTWPPAAARQLHREAAHHIARGSNRKLPSSCGRADSRTSGASSVSASGSSTSARAVMLTSLSPVPSDAVRLTAGSSARAWGMAMASFSIARPGADAAVFSLHARRASRRPSGKKRRAD